jgi:hypothetical protein
MLYELLTRPSDGGEYDPTGILSEAEIQDLVAFPMSLPYEELAE